MTAFYLLCAVLAYGFISFQLGCWWEGRKLDRIIRADREKAARVARRLA